MPPIASNGSGCAGTTDIPRTRGRTPLPTRASRAMARQVVLDTETTGLSAKTGDRVVEIGCVEIVSRRIGERQFHAYVNPERDIDVGASRVHGLTLEDLKDKPRFAEVAAEFLEFIRGAELVIHNA